MKRLFIAVWPPDEFLDLLADMERPKDQGVKWVRPENLHVTLRFLGDADDDDVSDRLREVALPAATAVVGPGIDVLSERSLVLPIDGVDELGAVVTRAVRGLGTQRERRRFIGHLTVARLARRARPERSVGRRFEASFSVDEVALVASTLTDRGAVYDTIASFPCVPIGV